MVGEVRKCGSSTILTLFRIPNLAWEVRELSNFFPEPSRCYLPTWKSRIQRSDPRREGNGQPQPVNHSFSVVSQKYPS